MLGSRALGLTLSTLVLATACGGGSSESEPRSAPEKPAAETFDRTTPAGTLEALLATLRDAERLDGDMLRPFIAANDPAGAPDDLLDHRESEDGYLESTRGLQGRFTPPVRGAGSPERWTSEVYLSGRWCRRAAGCVEGPGDGLVTLRPDPAQLGRFVLSGGELHELLEPPEDPRGAPTPPAPPADLRAVRRADGQVDLTWRPSGTDAAGYEVECDGLSEEGRVEAPATSLTYLPWKGTTYEGERDDECVVRAEDALGTQSTASTEVAVPAPAGAPTSAPAPSTSPTQVARDLPTAWTAYLVERLEDTRSEDARSRPLRVDDRGPAPQDDGRSVYRTSTYTARSPST